MDITDNRDIGTADKSPGSDLPVNAASAKRTIKLNLCCGGITIAHILISTGSNRRNTAWVCDYHIIV